MERVAIFIDGPHLHSVTRSLGFTTEFTKLNRALTGKTNRLVRSYYFSPIDVSSEHQTLRPLLDWLSYNGFHMVEKPFTSYVDENGNARRARDVSMGVEIALAAVEIAPRIDRLILVGGDADYAPVVEFVKARGVVVEVVSTLEGKVMIADGLRRAADTFTDIANLQSSIERIPSPRAVA